MTRRARHMLMAKVALDALAAKGRPPKSSSLAAGVHPGAARREFADLCDLPRRPDLIAWLGAAASLRLLGEASAYDSQRALQLGGTP